MADPLRPGSVFAGHRIEGVAGRGGMGVVYRATHLALDHVVALKVISPALASDERFRRRFGEESRIAVSIRHPNVVTIHHAGEEDGLLFVTMDLIDGTDLRGLLRAGGPLRPEHAARVIEEVAAALDAAHARGLVHRDIKPGNVLIEGEGPSERVYLTDFGLARAVEASTGVTATGAFVGTLDYVAPEQIRGERVDARADVYALGCVLFELLTGMPPFAAREDKVAKMYAHLQEEPPKPSVLRPDLPPELDPVIGRALAKDPSERFPSAGDFARAVSAAIEGQPTVETERSVAVGAAAPGPPDATTTAERLRSGGHPRAEAEPTREARPPDGDGVAEVSPVRAFRRRLRAGPLALAAGVAIAAVVAVVLVVSGGGSGQEKTGSGSGGSEPAAASAPPDGSIDGDPVAVGKLPVNLVHGEKGIYVTNRGSGTVSFVDGDPARVRATFAAGSAPEGIAFGAGSLWVSQGKGSTVLRLDPLSGRVQDEVAVGGLPGGVAFGRGAVWVANSGDGTVTRIDPDGGPSLTIEVGARPYGVAIGDDAVWVTNRDGDSLTRINPISKRPDPPIDVGDNPKGVAIAAGMAWVANTGDGTVSVVDNGAERKTIEVGSEPRDVVSAFGSVWVTKGAADQVARIDPSSERVVQTLGVGSGPEGITAGPKSVWVANGISEDLTRIDPNVAGGG